jgi:hypothetical protein
MGDLKGFVIHYIIITLSVSIALNVIAYFDVKRIIRETAKFYGYVLLSTIILAVILEWGF